MWRMKVSASIQNASTPSALLEPLGAQHVALEAHVVGLGGREGGEVVRAGQRGGAGVEPLAVERPRPPERAPALEGARLGPGEHAVAVGAAARVAAGVEALGRRLAGEHRHVVRQQRRSVRAGAGSPAWLATCPRA